MEGASAWAVRLVRAVCAAPSSRPRSNTVGHGSCCSSKGARRLTGGQVALAKAWDDAHLVHREGKGGLEGLGGFRGQGGAVAGCAPLLAG